MSLRDKLRDLNSGLPGHLVTWAAMLFWDNGLTSIESLNGAEFADLAGTEMCTATQRAHVKHLMTLAAARARRVEPRARSRSREGAVPIVPNPCPIEQAITCINAFERGTRVTAGPRGAIRELAGQLPANHAARGAWLQLERVRAILTPCQHSLPSVRSGMRCFRAFCFSVLMCNRVRLPPLPEELAAWAALFRCAETFRNYIGYLRIACLIVGADVSVFSCVLVRRAIQSVRARRDWVPRPKQFLGQAEVLKLLKLVGQSDACDQNLCMLWLFAYIFLSRVPSEALPVVRIDRESQRASHASAVLVQVDSVVLHLARRKNRPRGSTLVRTCWCSTCPSTCPVHVLGPFLLTHETGCRVFPHNAGDALQSLRRMLERVGFSKFATARTHDFRRGHASDLQRSGATLAEILRAGEWRSCAFMAYLEREELERDAVIEAHVAESDSESDAEEPEYP